MRTISHKAKFKHEDDGNYFAYPLPEGIETVKRDLTIGDVVNDVDKFIIVSNTVNNTIKKVLKHVYINNNLQSVNDLPALFQMENEHYRHYFYRWYDKGKLHRVNAPAKLWFRNGSLITSDFYLFGKPIDAGYYKWFKENGIKLSNMSEEDLLLFKMRWCDNV